MAYRFEDIPIDLLIHHIGNNIAFTDVTNLTLVSKSLYANMQSNIPHLFANIIRNNYALDFYLNELEFDIIDDIKKSALSFLKFEETMQAIRTNDVSSISFEFDKKTVDTSVESINATFKIFQMLAMESESFDEELTIAFIEAFTKALLQYFRALFQARNNVSNYDESYQVHNILNKSGTNGWHKVNINVYFLYENYNLLMASKRSYKFKSYIENDTNIIIINNHIRRNRYALMYLMTLMSNGTFQEKVFCFHEIMKLLNYIYALQKEKNSFSNECEVFTSTCLRKINEFRTYITENSTLLPQYFRKCIFAEYDRFIEITKH